ncbi:MAG TPA: hypothetical protein DCE42_10905 [Myxococcales bacterium]|nr:hypothetical protein [Deltaproteobacteria bacterium]MBU54561.1 hypothetical protein [Deltaproteobacteria bacterium]HAA55256.1 hypothetical protein [Myxococcales bacterium]|tara:strand:- start:27222 stop:27791 length:570 start_codon:yes stop_codon:yes gene_type:complete
MDTFHWEETRRRIEAFLRSRIKTQADVDDLLQEILLKLYRHLSKHGMPDEPVQWMYRVARNALIDHYRMGARAVEQVAFSPTDELGVELYDEREVEGASFEEEVQSWLLFWMHDLPPHYQEALEYVELRGLSQKDYAEQAGLSVSGAKSRVQRARKALRDSIMACCAFEFDRRGCVIDATPRSKEQCGC